MSDHANHPGYTAGNCHLRITVNAHRCGMSSNGFACSATGGHCLPERERCAELRGDQANEPITVTLPDGRVLAFVDYDFTRGDMGSRLDPPTPDEVSINAAWWNASDGTEMECTPDELDDLHNGPEYDAILTVCQDRYWSDLAADTGAYDDEDEP
jgi:hypothetical protein